ncbi:MAG: universal stress protein [Thermoplasmata archaeon]
MYDKVIVPTDGSEIAEIGVEEGLELAKNLDIPALSIYVIDFSTLEELGEGPHKDARRDMERIGERALTSVRKKAHEIGVDIETRNLIGKPYRKIVESANKNDIIYISSHGASGFSEIIFGSTTEKVLNDADCNVAVVKGK